jgi:hypothetical protein
MNNRMVLFLLTFALSSCNVSFWVSKDRVIRKQIGYLIYCPGNPIVFIPAYIDTSMSIFKNVQTHKLKLAMDLSAIRADELTYILLYSDTIQNGYIVPSLLTYYKKRQDIKTLRIQNKTVYRHFFVIHNERKEYSLKHKNIFPINIFPLINVCKKSNVILPK